MAEAAPPPPVPQQRRKPAIPSDLPTSTAFDSTPLFPHTTENCFSDRYGRTVLLRGLNVGGCSKVPTVIPRRHAEHDTVRYGGRPFKTVEEATEWWATLRLWGVGVIRWVMTWEAIAPKKIDEYDDDYIDYVYQVLEKAGEYGLKVFLDVHQDCWSRLSGGSGAPAWTFSLVGLDPRRFQSTFTSALLPPKPAPGTPGPPPYVFTEPHLPPHQTPHSQPSSHLWPTNYSKLATATMFTVFFAGNTFAPRATMPIPGRGVKNVGDVMQDAYINAFRYVARRLAGLECILGWDVMNEPHPGFVGLPSLTKWNPDTELHLGIMPNAVQGMILSSGGEDAPDKTFRLKLPVYERSWPRPSTLTTHIEYEVCKGYRAWLDGRKDIWKEEKVWWWDPAREEGFSFKEDYFTKHPQTGMPIDFERDFYEPFLRKFLVAVQEGRLDGLKDLSISPGGGMGQWSFIEPVPNIGPPEWVEQEGAEIYKATSTGGVGVCYAPHWYDLRACFEKKLSWTMSFDVGALALGSRNFLQHAYFGRLGLLGNYISQFSRVINHLHRFRRSGKPTPILIGETGVPFDLNEFHAYKTGDIRAQLVMLDSVVGAMERVNNGSLNWTLWNFTSENYVSASPKAGEIESGDGWNSEDFSLVSMDKAMTEIPYLPLSPLTRVPQVARATSMTPNNSGVILNRAREFGDLYAGARCVGAWIRPYPPRTAGVLQQSEFTLANVAGGNKACWGGTFHMGYVANSSTTPTPVSEGNDEDEGTPTPTPMQSSFSGAEQHPISHKTEIFLPVYHYAGEPWQLRISVSLPPNSRSLSHSLPPLIATIIIIAAESTGLIPVESLPGGSVSWEYSEARQSLNIVHSEALAGWLIDVVCEAGVEEASKTGSGRARKGVMTYCVGAVLTAIVGIVVAGVVGTWYISETMEVRRVEFYGRER